MAHYEAERKATSGVRIRSFCRVISMSDRADGRPLFPFYIDAQPLNDESKS